MKKPKPKRWKPGEQRMSLRQRGLLCSRRKGGTFVNPVYCEAPTTKKVFDMAFCDACEAEFRDDYEHERNFLGIWGKAHGKKYPEPVPFPLPSTRKKPS